MNSVGIVGWKLGMSRVFTALGQSVPVTVVEVDANRVSGMKEVSAHGYRAVQIAWGHKRIERVGKAEAGIFSKAKIGAAQGLLEYRLRERESVDLKIGEEIRADIFSEGDRVDVTGRTNGKGFAGVIKRHNFSSQRMSHGNSLSHRAPGSIGQCQTPGRVFKGKKMAGRLGNRRCTVQNLEVVRVDSERNLLLLRGAVPAVKGGRVVVRPAVKKKREKK